MLRLRNLPSNFSVCVPLSASAGLAIESIWIEGVRFESVWGPMYVMIESIGFGMESVWVERDRSAQVVEEIRFMLQSIRFGM